ncbi:MAG: hypothetical protein CMK44_07560 [Porticoccus sp.]|jgi:uncharacterized membrane protein YgdD (TMEM256/DUF423 family)|nr:hypothetical protein [Porticoccus sp.]|tara:strand:+ start:1124 stop:1525 length:402 start_codon:yes stop_codon:yes gene_type:complete
MNILGCITALLGFFAVALGAFGAHALKNSASPEMLNIWQTAVHYQMFHVLALLSVILLERLDANVRMQWSIVGWLFVMGCVIFSGSLYLLVITEIQLFGAITPIGGSLFLAGWIGLFYCLVTISKKNKPQLPD